MDHPPRVRTRASHLRHTGLPARTRTLCSYWGALTNSSKLTGNLEAWFVDRDGDRIGQGMARAVQNFVPTGPALNWTFQDPLLVGNDTAIIDAVLQERVWVAIVSECPPPRL